MVELQTTDMAIMGSDDDARKAAQKLLLKWRPHVIEKETSTNGTLGDIKPPAISPSPAPTPNAVHAT